METLGSVSNNSATPKFPREYAFLSASLLLADGSTLESANNTLTVSTCPFKDAFLSASLLFADGSTVELAIKNLTISTSPLLDAKVLLEHYGKCERTTASSFKKLYLGVT